MTSALPTVIGLGRLVDFIIRDAQGRRLRVTPTGERWLAWKPDTRDLLVLKPGLGSTCVTLPTNAERHKAFHGAEPQSARQMEWPVLSRIRCVLGLIESVTYSASGIISPSKGLHQWIHQFGDRGEVGHGSVRTLGKSQYSSQFYPRLEVDAIGNLSVVRRPRNRYTVKNWIIG